MSDALRVLAGPGGVRKISARWVFCADLVLVSPAHFGGGGDDLADMMLLRDARSGLPLLPGTSIAGALREYLQTVLAGHAYRIGDERFTEDSRVEMLFGGAKGDEEGSQSPLIVFDSVVRPHDEKLGVPTEIRDGVHIDGPSGVAADHKKFDYEVLPAGTTFPLRFELLISDLDREAELVNLLVTCLDGLRPGEIAFGARRTRGFGRVRARDWRVHRFDLTTRDGWLTWLCTHPEEPFPAGSPARRETAKSVRTAVREVFGERLPGELEDKRSRVLVTAELEVAGPMMIGSPGSEADDPDRTHIHSGGKPVLPATSLVGAMRNRALRIARLVRDEYGDAEAWVDRLFGYVPAEETDQVDGVEGFDKNAVGAEVSRLARSSRLIVSEGIIENGESYRPTRVSIDRFTQGVVKHKLFDEQPHHGGTVRVNFELRDPYPGELGLLLLVLKDLFDGDLPLGGTTGIGRGLVKGTGTLRFRGIDRAVDSIPLVLERDAGVGSKQRPTPEHLAILEDEVRQFAGADVIAAMDGRLSHG